MPAFPIKGLNYSHYLSVKVFRILIPHKSGARSRQLLLCYLAWRPSLMRREMQKTLLRLPYLVLSHCRDLPWGASAAGGIARATLWLWVEFHVEPSNICFSQKRQDPWLPLFQFHFSLINVDIKTKPHITLCRPQDSTI